METLVVTLTLTTIVAFLSLLVGGMIGWMARQHSYETQPGAYWAHPEMFDRNGKVIPEEIHAVRFENPEALEDDDED